jgi:hypothetical protein
VPSPDEKPAYVGNPLAGDPIWEASSAFELRIAITTKQVSRAGHPSDLLVAKGRAAASTLLRDRKPTAPAVSCLLGTTSESEGQDCRFATRLSGNRPAGARALLAVGHPIDAPSRILQGPLEMPA